jgi:D-amino peptidase
VTDVSINGVSLPEAGYNALIAGHYGVPVVFVAGDRALCQQVEALFGTVETVAVKEGIGSAALTLHPEVTRERIRTGVASALSDLSRFEAYDLGAPYTLVLTMKDEVVVYNGSFYPGAERTGEWELTFTADNIMDVMTAYSFMRR